MAEETSGMILYQDAHLLLVEKPAGVLAQADAAGGDSLPARLARQGLAVKPVHRLDKATGGVMVYALSDWAAAALSALVGQHDRFVKDYLAVVAGCPEPPAGVYEDLLYHDARRNKSYVVKRKRNGVRQASLSYTVCQTVALPQGTFSLVRVRLHTGRTHQIRVQFASRGTPLCGDGLYGGVRGCPLALWSCRLTFPHPVTGQILTAASQPDAAVFPWNLFAEEHLLCN